MTRVLVQNFAISLDGFAAGPRQREDAPLGDGGLGLHEWIFATRAWRASHGGEGGEEGLDNDYALAGSKQIGATIMGRNMFGPVRGPWGDEPWRGWWGEDPPFGGDVFVLTHHPRPSLAMPNGTTFHFVGGSPAEVLERARESAGGRDVKLAGGASTIQQFMRAGLVDELHIAIAPILLEDGERLFDGPVGSLGAYECTALQSSSAVVHVRLTRTH